MEDIYSEYEDKVALVTGGAGFTGSVPPKREAMLPEPSPYAISNPDCEYLARMFYTDHSLRTTCLRYFNVYGPRQDPKLSICGGHPDIPVLRACG